MISAIKNKKVIFLAILLTVSLIFYFGTMFPQEKQETRVKTSKKPIKIVKAVIAKPKPFYNAEKINTEKITPQIKEYTVDKDLNNVANIEQFGKFTYAQKKMLAKNLFMVAPTNEIQLFHIYENNDYYNIPSFISTDSVLQLYHILYNYSLREVEAGKLLPVLKDLTKGMFLKSVDVYESVTDPDLKKAAFKNAAFFGVAAKILELNIKIPEPIKQTVDKEIKLIEIHGSTGESAIFPFNVDYTQFIPRGHYTRTEDFKKFFKAMMWYGLIPFPFYSNSEKQEQVQQAILITHILLNKNIGKYQAFVLWEKIYESTVFYVGKTDDLSIYDFKELIDKVYGKNWQLADFADKDKLKTFVKKSTELRQPEIKQQSADIPTGLQFRFMGQRYIPDSEILQKLSHFPDRPFPKGLDVMAVLGSNRAYEILDKTYQEPKKWDEFVERFTALKKKFSAISIKDWQWNLYYGWLWSLKAIIQEKPQGYPSFMLNNAWLDKSLNTSLASWAELRHDTILYAKQSSAECGDAEDERSFPKGYVEPDIEFYNRILILTKMSKNGLKERGLLSEGAENAFSQFEELVTFLINISAKELTNQKITREEYDQIKIYGAVMERITLTIAGNGAYLSKEDENMAVIADIHNSGGGVLEVGVGKANEIFVIVPIEGKLYLTRGAVFSYYEFTHPSSNRLTDGEWQKMLEEKRAPKTPIWTDSFTTESKDEIPQPKEIYSSGC